MVVKTSSDEKQRKRYGSLNRNEFRREEDDDVSKRTDFGGHEIRVRGHSIHWEQKFHSSSFEIAKLSG